jgi:hypothetical protein
MDNYNYPAGADISSAPWNQKKQESEPVEVTIIQTFSKDLEVLVNDYESIKESDEDGTYYWNDYSGCNLKEAVEEQHLTITDILDKVKDLHNQFENLDLTNTKKVELFKHELLILSVACDGWNEDEMEVVQ